jgi:uncharacterized membrane protein
VATAVTPNGDRLSGYGYNAQGKLEAFQWSLGLGMTGIGLMSGRETIANAMSDDGSVIAGYARDAVGQYGFRWTSSTGFTSLGALPQGSTRSEVNAMSGDGDVLVGRLIVPTGSAAFKWTLADGIVALENTPGGNSGFANAVSGDGSIIVGQMGGPEVEAAVWDVNGVQPLRSRLIASGVDMSSWLLTEAYDISTDGSVVVGSGLRNGVSSYFMATLPEPSGVCLSLGILISIGMRRRGSSAITTSMSGSSTLQI